MKWEIAKPNCSHFVRNWLSIMTSSLSSNSDGCMASGEQDSCHKLIIVMFREKIIKHFPFYIETWNFLCESQHIFLHKTTNSSKNWWQFLTRKLFRIICLCAAKNNLQFVFKAVTFSFFYWPHRAMKLFVFNLS